MSELNQTEVMSLVEELKTLTTKNNTESAEVKEKIVKIEKALEKNDAANQKLTLELAEKHKKEVEYEEKLKGLERLVTMTGNGAVSQERKGESKKSLETYLKTGQMTEEYRNQKYYRTDNNVDGGYVVDPEFVLEIIKKITEIDPIRSVARVRTTSSNRFELPIRSSLISSYFIGEGKDGAPSQSKYGKEMFKLHKMMTVAKVTVEELNTAAFNMEMEINDDVVESRAAREGLSFVKGTGVNEPMGLMVDPEVNFIKSGDASDATIDNLIDLSGELKTGYNPMYGFNRNTLAYFRKQKGTDGQYLWVAGNISAGVPNTINGYPYIEIPSLDNVAANKYPVIFADFARAYLIGDHTFSSALRDDYSLSTQGMVQLIFSNFVAGGVVNPEAIIKLKIAL